MLSGAHLHLLVNHLPIIGAFLALALLVASYRWAPDVLRRTALVMLVVTALGAAGANYSGEPAEDAIRRFPGVTREVIHEHEEVAETAFIGAVVVGVLALGALVRWRRTPIPRSASVTMLLGAVVASGMMAYVGLLGGRIRHSEVRPGATPADAVVVDAPRVGEAKGEGE
jgi:uncharacterized membrane protein